MAFLVRRFPAGWFHPCSLPPLSLGEVQSVARQPAPCEAGVHSRGVHRVLSGPEDQVVGPWLPGPVTWIWPQSRWDILRFLELLVIFMQSGQSDSVCTSWIFLFYSLLPFLHFHKQPVYSFLFGL